MSRNIKIIAAAAAFSVAPFAVAPAFAGSQADVNNCKTLISQDAKAAGASVSFKGSSGAATKKYRFEVKSETDMKKVVCKVKRGKVLGLEWAE